MNLNYYSFASQCRNLICSDCAVSLLPFNHCCTYKVQIRVLSSGVKHPVYSLIMKDPSENITSHNN